MPISVLHHTFPVTTRSLFIAIIASLPHSHSLISFLAEITTYASIIDFTSLPSLLRDVAALPRLCVRTHIRVSEYSGLNREHITSRIVDRHQQRFGTMHYMANCASEHVRLCEMKEDPPKEKNNPATQRFLSSSPRNKTANLPQLSRGIIVLEIWLPRDLKAHAPTVLHNRLIYAPSFNQNSVYLSALYLSAVRFSVIGNNAAAFKTRCFSTGPSGRPKWS